MISESEVRKELISYLKDSISLAEFENWLVSRSWNMRLNTDAVANDLMADVELSLSEYSAAHLTLTQLRKKLSDAVSHL